ncbi:uncharacterized protein [Montipora foliosa]|uniref:uncharacterized protein isoform X1 n=1 Tax=Montipora foliosa TaxID=591990 RepID=UPI0035F2180F
MASSSKFSLAIAIFLSVTALTEGQTCYSDHVLTKTFGIISFQGQSYYRGENKSWKIIAPLGHSVGINLTSYFIATCQPQTEKCKCHSLTVKDGECSNSSVIGKYCGVFDKSLVLSSTGRYLRLEYQSDKEDDEDYFNVNYAAVQKCPASGGYPDKCPSSRMAYSQCCHANGEGGCCFYDGNRCHTSTAINATRDYCPRPQDDQSMKVCCVTNGEASCCKSGGNRCHGDGRFRDYCPGSDEDFRKTTCCSFHGNDTCCLPGRKFCYDSGAGTRSYCPSREHSFEETVCCLQNGKPSCCKPQQTPPACSPFPRGHTLNEAECIVIWVFVAIVGLVFFILVGLACQTWTCFHCLVDPLWECLSIFYEQLKRFFRYILFYASLFLTTIVFTFACCICFAVIQEWPWKRAHRIVSEKLPGYARKENAVSPDAYYPE